jgi:phosphate uptake regulator
MEKRRIQKTGISSYTVSLPKTWVSKNNIKPGDYVTINEEGNQSLRLSLGEKLSPELDKEIKAGKYKSEEEIIRKFISYYLNGATRITIVSKYPFSSDYMKNMHKNIKKVIGFEIVEESENTLVFQDFFTSNYLSVEKTIRRAFNISCLIGNESINILSGGSDENIMLWEEEVNKLYLLIRRQINFALHNSYILNQLNITVKECQDYILLMSAIEKITDSFVEIAKVAVTLNSIPDRIKSEIRRLYDSLSETYKNAVESVFRKNFDLSNEALIKNEDNIKIWIKQHRVLDLPEDKKRNLYLLFFYLNSTAVFIEEIAETGLDAEER